MPMYLMSLKIRKRAWDFHDYGDYTCHALGDVTEVTSTVTLSKTGMDYKSVQKLNFIPASWRTPTLYPSCLSPIL